MNRREVLIGLAALAGCPFRRAPQLAELAELPEGPVALGWRFVPGMTIRYRSVVVRRAGGRVASRAEEWTYLVRELDTDDVATLDGRLTGFGAGVDVDGQPLPDVLLTQRRRDEIDRARPVTLRMAMDGRILDISERGFERTVRHHLLALRVPVTPVLPLDEWRDPGLVRPFRELVPPAMDTVVDGSARLLELHRSGGSTLAAIDARGSVRVASGPAIRLTASASWDAERGVLAERRQEVRFLPSTGDPSLDPGTLSLHLLRA